MAFFRGDPCNAAGIFYTYKIQVSLYCIAEADNISFPRRLNLIMHIKNFSKAYRSWLLPYIKSRLHPDEFRPVLSFLFTDLDCNLDCPYCYSRGKTIQDVKSLTQLAHDYGVATDYHINEQPLIPYRHFKNEEDGAWITEREIKAVDELVDWLIEKNRI